MERIPLTSNDFDEFNLSRHKPVLRLKPLIYMCMAVVVFVSFGMPNTIFLSINEKPNTNMSVIPTYSELVKRNIKALLEDKEVIHMQAKEGPIRPFVNIYAAYPTALNYNLTACYVPKVLSTTLGSIFCYLSNSTGFKENNMDMKTVYWANPFCVKNRPTLGSTAQLRDFLPANASSFVVIRDPIERFVSAFINKCVDELAQVNLYKKNRTVCFGCDDDINCVVKMMYRAAMNVSRTGIWLGSQADKGYAMIHFNPLSWNCDMSFRHNDTVYIKYASGGTEKVKMATDIMNVMRNAGVEEYKLDEISAVLLEDKPLTHATKGTSKPHKYREIIYNSQELLDILKNLYYYDFQLFGFPMPELGKIPQD